MLLDGREVFLDLAQVHPEPQTHLCQNPLDLVERLLAEVLELEEVGFGAFDDLPDELDTLVLEDLVGARGEFELLPTLGELFDLVREVGGW